MAKRENIATFGNSATKAGNKNTQITNPRELRVIKEITPICVIQLV